MINLEQRKQVYILALEDMQTEPPLPQKTDYLINIIRRLLNGKVTSINLDDACNITEIIEMVCLGGVQDFKKLPIELIEDYNRDRKFVKIFETGGNGSKKLYQKQVNSNKIPSLIDDILYLCNSRVVGGDFKKLQKNRIWMQYSSNLCRIITNICMDLNLVHRPTTMEYFPEIFNQKPPEILENGFWFELNEEGYNKRIEVLKQAINNCYNNTN